AQIRQLGGELVSFPEKERKYIDAERGYNMIEAVYNSLLTKQNDTKIRVAANKSDITIIDPAKNLNQSPISPDVNKIKYTIIGGLLLLPLLVIAGSEVLDNKIRNIKELTKVTRIPLLGVIGKN